MKPETQNVSCIVLTKFSFDLTGDIVSDPKSHDLKLDQDILKANFLSSFHSDIDEKCGLQIVKKVLL